MKSVVIVQRRMTHYRVPLFELMRDKLRLQSVELKVVVGDSMPGEDARKDSGYLSWASHVPCKYLFGNRLCWQNLRVEVRDADLLVFPQENKMIFSLIYCLPSLRGNVALWGHGRNYQSKKNSWFLETLKRWYSRKPHWWFVYTKRSEVEVQRLGFSEKRITVLNNYIDDTELRHLLNSINDLEIHKMRTSLNAKGHVGLYVGSLTVEKRIDFLLRAAREIKLRNEDFTLILIGDGPEKHLLNSLSDSDKAWIHWLGMKTGRDKAIALKSADVILNPGMVGLNIVDSLISGRPMITCDLSFHSPEIFYIENNRNGLVLRDDIHEYASGVVNVLADSGRLSKMSAECLSDSHLYSLDAMANNFCSGVLRAIGRN